MTLKTAVIGLCILFVSLLCLTPVQAGATKIKGNLYSLNSHDHTVTLKDATGKLQTLNVGAARLKRNGARTTLSGFVIGDKLAVQFPSGAMNPKKLQASGPKVSTVSGALQGVNSSNSSIQVGGKSYKAIAKTRVIRNGKVASLSKLTKRDTVTAHVSSSGDCEDIDGEGPDDSEVSGVIAAVDAGAGTITITPDDGSPDITLTVTTDTEIELDGDDATLADLVAGDSVEAEYDPTTMVAYSIDAESAEDEGEISGTITAIDLTLGTVTVQDDSGNSVTVTVTASTEIFLDDQSAFLTDLAVGDTADVEYNTLTMEASSIHAQTPEPAEIDGTITALDAGAGTVTITGESDQGDCGDVTVTVSTDASTQIFLDDQPATFADLQTGYEAEASYDPTTLLASEIDASSDTEDDAPVVKSPASHAPSSKTHGKKHTQSQTPARNRH